MSTELLDGKKLAEEIRDDIKRKVEELSKQNIQPKLSVVTATSDGGTEFYVRHIQKAGENTGVKVDVVRLSDSASEQEITKAVQKLASDKTVHGIILQAPVPNGVNANVIRSHIPIEKDVDGANPQSAGNLISGLKAFAPSTAVAVMELLKRYDIPVSGTHSVIIGRSLVVGKPLAHLLLSQDATVTICHSKTRDLKSITRTADILIVAIGNPSMVDADYIKPGAIVVDVGTSSSDNGLLGDVNHKSMQNVAGAFSPVPGGVGPVTTSILLKQTIAATN